MSSSITIPSTMHGWTHTAKGPPSRVLHLVSNLPVRHPKNSSQLLVKISHAALNPGGAIMMHFCPFLFRHSPAIPEMDFAGTVVEVGSSSPGGQQETDGLLSSQSTFKVGDKVFGSIDVPEHIGGGHGALAEYAVVNAAHCIKVPAGAEMDECAGLAIAGTTAVTLVNAAYLGEGDRVLINGASGGIGSLVVQLVKGIVGKSGKVVGICSGRNTDFVLGLGADEVVDYTAHNSVTLHLAQRYGADKFTHVIDAIGIQGIWEGAASYLQDNGPFVTVGVANQSYTWGSLFHILWLMMLKNPFQPVWLGGVPRKYVRITAFINKETIEGLGELVHDGKLKGVVDSVWELEDVKRGYEVLLKKRGRGKLIIKVGE